MDQPYTVENKLHANKLVTHKHHKKCSHFQQRHVQYVRAQYTSRVGRLAVVADVPECQQAYAPPLSVSAAMVSPVATSVFRLKGLTNTNDTMPLLLALTNGVTSTILT